MKKTWVIVVIAVVLIFALLYCGLIGWLLLRLGRGKKASYSLLGGNQIALIRIDGVITSSGEAAGLLSSVSGTSSEEVVKQLRKADEDEDVKAILLRIDSPGGTAAGGEEIYREVKRTKKPIVASIADMGASAAYLIASASDKIVAGQASDVGSIGVIYAIPNMAELYKKLGIDWQVISKGKYKDMGSEFRPLTEEERKIIEEEEEILYQMFIKLVVEGRKGKKGSLNYVKVKELATGRTWVGQEALKLGLIDELGNYQDAVDVAKKLGKIEGEPEVVEYSAPSFLEQVEGLTGGNKINLIDLLLLKDLQSIPSQSK